MKTRPSNSGVLTSLIFSSSTRMRELDLSVIMISKVKFLNLTKVAFDKVWFFLKETLGKVPTLKEGQCTAVMYLH